MAPIVDSSSIWFRFYLVHDCNLRLWGEGKMSKDTGYKTLKKASLFNFIKWGEYMKRANLAERKVEKLKALILLVDPCVSSTEVGDTQLKQWSEYLKHFPEDI